MGSNEPDTSQIATASGELFYRDERNVYRAAALDALPWLDHGFGTRLSDRWVSSPYAWVRQIHSGICIAANGEGGYLGEGDCLLTATPGLHLTIRTADCVPILLADSEHRAVAAVHSGCRGAAQNIAANAVAAMRSHFRSSPGGLVAAIGPGICGKCYEVGPEVARQFSQWFPALENVQTAARIDLSEIVRTQLARAGLDPARIISGAPCTFCRSSEFHSWRRDHIQGVRMVSAIRIRPA